MHRTRLRLPVGLLLSTIALAVFPSALLASQISYAVDDNNDLYNIDLSNARATEIGTVSGILNSAFLEGIAISPSGNLYGTDSNGILYRISPGGAASVVGETGLEDVEGVAFSGNLLLGTDFNSPSTLYSLNAGTASPSALFSLSQGPLRALAANADTAFAASDSPLVQSLISVDLSNGATNVVGTLPSGFFSALALAGDNNLYALDATGDEYLINPTNASGTLIGNTGGQNWLDLTVAATPSNSHFIIVTYVCSLPNSQFGTIVPSASFACANGVDPQTQFLLIGVTPGLGLDGATYVNAYSFATTSSQEPPATAPDPGTSELMASGGLLLALRSLLRRAGSQ